MLNNDGGYNATAKSHNDIFMYPLERNGYYLMEEDSFEHYSNKYARQGTTFELHLKSNNIELFRFKDGFKLVLK